jgi:hypothetical protein
MGPLGVVARIQRISNGLLPSRFVTGNRPTRNEPAATNDRDSPVQRPVPPTASKEESL